MDSGLALVIGAVVGVLGSVLAPWIRDVVERRGREHREKKAERAIAIAQLIDAFQNRFAGVESKRSDLESLGGDLRDHGKASLALTKFALVLEPREQPLEALATSTLNAITVGRGSGPIYALQIVLHAWHREPHRRVEQFIATFASIGRTQGFTLNREDYAITFPTERPARSPRGAFGQTLPS